jgi:hypothetical protein
LLVHLDGGEAEGPPADWDVGHFVNLAAVVRGPHGSLLVVGDSYRSLGWDGHHLQPAGAFAKALARGGGREGGIHCICSTAEAGGVRARLRDAGYDVRHWDNGTADPGR